MTKPFNLYYFYTFDIFMNVPNKMLGYVIQEIGQTHEDAN